MRVSILVNVAVFAIVHTMATLGTTASSGDGQEERVSPIGAILALDAAIQKRFEKVDRRFGYARIETPGGAHGFAPENDAELSCLRELEDANLRVVLYLGGRDIVRPDERRARLSGPIKGPAFITRGPKFATPLAESLSMEARRAFAAFERKEPQHEFEVERWNVLARPVRAVNDTCLKCHWSTGSPSPRSGPSDLRVGDVLGVVFYAYAYQESGRQRTAPAPTRSSLPSCAAGSACRSCVGSTCTTPT
jgi:hypothetical protein